MKSSALLLLVQLLAMNWEGHDDWMSDLPPAIALEQAVKEAALLPPTPCEAREHLHDNPYEQIPLRCDDREAPPTVR